MNGLYKGYFKDIIILESEAKDGIRIICSGFKYHRNKVCEGTDIEFKLTDRNKALFFSKGLSIIDSLEMLDIHGSIFHGQIIHAINKSNTEVQLNYVGINIIV